MLKFRTIKRKKNKVFSELFIINACFTTIAIISYVIVIFSVTSLRNNVFLFLCCGLQIALSYFNIDWFYQGIEDYKYITLRNIVVKVFCLIAIVAFVRNTDDYIIYALISSVAISLNYVFNILHARRFISLVFGGISFKRHFMPLLILALSVFLSSAYSKIDVTMLGSMSTNNAIGLYNNSHKSVDAFITVCISISAVFLPRLSYYYERDRKEFLMLIQKGIKILSFISFPVCFGVFILSPYILKILYGEEFVAGDLTLRIFSVLIIIKSFGNLLCYQLVIATGNEKKRLPAYLIAALLNVMLNAILIPKLAQNGAAIASVISEIVVNGVQLYAMNKLIKIEFPIKVILQNLITAFAMGCIIIFIFFFDLNYILQFTLAVIIGSMFYLSVSILLKNEMAVMGVNMIKSRIRRRL